MKQIFLKTIFVFFLVFNFNSCTKEENIEIELNKLQNLQSNFSLENFSNQFIKENLIIVWDDYILNEENNESTYELNTHFKTETTLSNGKIQITTKYKLLASKNEAGIYEYELIKFLLINDTLTTTLSYFNPSFTGTLYHYNLNGETVKIKAFKDGKLLSEFSDSKIGNVFSKSQSTEGSGTFQRVCTEDYTDWYHVYEGVAHYTHSVKTGESCDWVYLESDVSGPGGGFNTIFHNHYDGAHGTNGTSNINHDNEVIFDDIIVVNAADPDKIITNMADYLKCFDATQSASLTIYVNEPTDGSNNLVGLDRVGHTFVSIQQGNNIATFGFYPQDTVSSLFQGTQGVMEDNSNTTYDVSLTINNISSSALQQIITLSKSYSISDYHLSQRNCTDMGIDLGNLVGLPIPECNANPIYFFGSTPGRLGEYMRNLTLPNGVTRNISGGNSPKIIVININ